MKSLLISLSVSFLVGCTGAQVRQDQLDFDKQRLTIYQQNQLEQNKIKAIEAQAIAEICKADANPASCAIGMRLAGGTGSSNQTAQIPQRTPVAPNKFWDRTTSLLGKSLDVGLAFYGIQQSNKTSRYATDSNNRMILGLVDSVGDSSGIHLGNGSEYYGADYFQDNSDNSDNSVDNSVAVGGDQSIAGRDVISGHVGDTIGGDQVGEDQFTAGSDIAIGTANFNTGRIDADGPFVECSSGDSGNSGNGGPAGNGGAGVGSTGGLGTGTGGTGTTGLTSCVGE